MTRKFVCSACGKPYSHDGVWVKRHIKIHRMKIKKSQLSNKKNDIKVMMRLGLDEF